MPAVNKALDKDYAQLYDKITVIRTKTFELSQASSVGNEQLSDTLYNEVQVLLRDAQKLCLNINRWRDEIVQFGGKQGFEMP